MAAFFDGKRSKPLVLHVDDDKDIRGMIALTLEAMGIDVLSAEDGPSGLAAARKERPDLVILDVRMPGMDGFEVCGVLKFDPATSALKILMLTAMDQGKDTEKALASGADSYVTKPLDYNRFKAKVRSMLGMPPPSSPDNKI